MEKNGMNTKLAICVAALSLVASGASAQQFWECEREIMMVEDMLADPVIAAGDPATLTAANDLVDAAVVECDGSETGRSAALALLANAKELLGHPD